MDLVTLIQPGDILLYDKHALINELIKLKRGEQYSHVEVALSQTESVASRNGIGVGKYPLYLDGLAAIYRSHQPLDVAKAMEWFKTVDGQGYDWLGLLSFTWAKFRAQFANNNKMFCSEFATRFYRAGGAELFNPQTDADAISPEMLSYSPIVYPVWLRDDKKPHEN